MELSRVILLIIGCVTIFACWSASVKGRRYDTVVVNRNANQVLLLKTLTQQKDPVVHYSIPQATVIRKDSSGQEVVFYKYREKQCVGGFDLGRVASLEEAFETCAKRKVCQSISCHNKRACRITSPTCILQTSVADKHEAYVIIARTPNRLHLYEKLLQDLPTTEVLKNQTGRRLASGEKHVKNIAWNPQSSVWKDGNFQRNYSELPYIELTRSDHFTMGPLVNVDPIHKIVIVRVAKVQSTNIYRLYDRLVGHQDIINDEKGHIRVHSRQAQNDPHRERIAFKDLDTDTCNRIMNDPSYRKVVFFRDPVDRFLSCYLDKFKRQHYSTIFGQKKGTTTFDELLSFVDTDGFPPYGVGPGVNYHYQAQVLTSNLFKFLPLFDFIGWGNNAHTKLMLEKYGLWDDFGNKTWPHGFMKSGDNHPTGSKDKKATYLNDSTIKIAKHAYDIDYHFFRHIGLEKGGPPVDGSRLVPFFSHCSNSACWPAYPDA